MGLGRSIQQWNLTTPLLFMDGMEVKDLVVYRVTANASLTVISVRNSLLNFLGAKLFTAPSHSGNHFNSTKYVLGHICS